MWSSTWSAQPPGTSLPMKLDDDILRYDRKRFEPSFQTIHDGENRKGCYQDTGSFRLLEDTVWNLHEHNTLPAKALFPTHHSYAFLRYCGNGIVFRGKQVSLCRSQLASWGHLFDLLWGEPLRMPTSPKMHLCGRCCWKRSKFDWKPVRLSKLQ